MLTRHGVGKATLVMRVFGKVRTSNPILKIQGFYIVERLENHPGTTFFTLHKSNRDAIREQIYAELVGVLQNHRSLHADTSSW